MKAKRPQQPSQQGVPVAAATVSAPQAAQANVDESPRQRAQQAQVSQLRSNSQGLPEALRGGIETLSGMDMGDVRVHRNSTKAAQLNAHAYAQGNQIHLGPGQDRHLPHEAWHVVQQRQGRVKPTASVGGVAVNDNAALEREADRMGAKAGSIAQTKARDGVGLGGVEVEAGAYGTVQRLVVSAAAGAVAPLGPAGVRAWVIANASPKVRTLAQHADVNLNITWQAALIGGAHADTRMNIQWTDNAGGVHGPLSLFNVGNSAAIGAMNFDTLADYTIDVDTRIVLPPAGGTTWQGTLIHELEAHSGLAYTTMKLIDAARRTRLQRENFAEKIDTTMTARDVAAEHLNWAHGGGGSEDAMTRVVQSTARANRVDVIVDIATDRTAELVGNTPPAPAIGPDPHRLVYNAGMSRIRRWCATMKRELHHPNMSGAEEGRIDVAIAAAADR